MALNVAAHYPDRPRLLEAMADLAVEEISHYREVVRLMLARGVEPSRDTKDPYVTALNKSLRQGPQRYLQDRLLLAAVIEARGAERFALLADHLTDPALRRFYRSIARSEARHWQLFTELAEHYFPQADLAPRLAELCAIEADIVDRLPVRAALH